MQQPLALYGVALLALNGLALLWSASDVDGGRFLTRAWRHVLEADSSFEWSVGLISRDLPWRIRWIHKAVRADRGLGRLAVEAKEGSELMQTPVHLDKRSKLSRHDPCDCLSAGVPTLNC
jgi:hypothetical protein